MRPYTIALALLLPLAASADAYKCRDSDGRLIFTDSSCPKGTKTERVQGKDVISPEQKAQTDELNARTQKRLQELQREKTERSDGKDAPKKERSDDKSPAEKREQDSPAAPDNGREAGKPATTDNKED